MLTTVSNGLDKVADAIPLPKQPTKVGIAVVGGMIVFGLVKQVVNTVLFIGAAVGVGYLLINRDNDDSDKTSSISSTQSSSKGADDPMAEVDRIMDKYK